jgi:DNA-binding transcriptional regulator YdaS (Cro superfamily)
MFDLKTALNAGPRGLKSRIAELCKISPNAVYQWEKVPAEHVHVVEAVLSVPRSKIRPDLYPPARESQPEKAA